MGTGLPLHAEVDGGADAAVVQRLDRTHVIAHTEEDLRGLILAEQPHGMHLQGQYSKTLHTTALVHH